MTRRFFPNDVQQQLARSLEVVRKILDTSKNPVEPAKLDHEYEDKYALVEFLTNTGIAATLNVLEQLDGFNGEVLKQVVFVVQGQQRTMTLRLAVEEDCEFVEERTRTIESPRHEVTVDSSVTETGNANNNTGTPNSTTNQHVYSHKVVKEVKEYHWKAGIRHRIILFAGTDPSMGIVLGDRTGTAHLVTGMKKTPFPPNTRSPIDLDLTWLIRQIKQDTLECSFVIDREQAKTPRRNKQTEEALDFIRNLNRWARASLFYFQDTVNNELLFGQKEECPARWLTKIDASNVFVPVVPLFQEYSRGEEEIGTITADKCGAVALPKFKSPLMPLQDTTSFLKEQCRSLENALLDTAGNFPDPGDQEQLVSGYEAKLVLLWLHIVSATEQWREGIEYVEEMLCKQLISAIGKEVQASDFTEFMKFHNQRMLGKAFSPKPFCYAIRQPNQYPDGTISIETTRASGFGSPRTEGNPIESFSRHIPGDSLVAPMAIPLNAATTVDFIGDQYLHGWLDTSFASQPGEEFFISARARQFSCFLLLTGSISGPNEFTPKDAIIIQNKDEALIPLLTTVLPSAKEFRDAIKSLSPEQARFAKSFRAMQLDSSVFGICVIQVKPQMEALLDLPSNALTKEIQLTQDLLSLFVDYQIPPNLVSYDGDPAASEKVATVKQHVKGVMDVITGIKENQLQEEKKKADMRSEMNTQLRSAELPGEMQLHRRVVDRHALQNCSLGAAVLASATFSPQAAFFGGPPVNACFTPSIPPSARTASSAPPAFQAQHFAIKTADVADGFDTLQDQFSDLDLERSDEDEQTDFTAIPKHLDRMFESFDKEGALRTMTLKAGDEWTRTHQQNLLTKMETTTLTGDAKKRETKKALDLLDALSRSGSLPVASGELHIIIGVRHSFEKNVMATVIADNVNPVEKVDYSSLLMAATIHKVDIPTLLVNSSEPPLLVLKDRHFPPLLMDDEDDGDDENAGT